MLDIVHPMDAPLFKGLTTTPEMREVFQADGVVQGWLDVEAALAEARHRVPGIATVEADGAALPFASSAFDGVLAECSLSLMPNLPGTLREIRRVLSPEGCLVATDLFRRGDDDPGPVPSCLRGLTTRAGWRSLLETHGFRLVLWEDHAEVLKQFVGRIILAGGTVRDIWAGSSGSADADGIATAMKRIRPSYALLVARR